MRLDFVKIFIETTTEMLSQMIGPAVDVSAMAMSPTPVAGREVMSVIGLTGDVEGRVIFDMDLLTAVQVAGCLVGEPSPGMTPMVRSSIAELSSMAIGRAISRINDEGTKIRMSPPTVITGTNLVSHDQCFETLIAPITTAYGEVRVNITIRDLN